MLASKRAHCDQGEEVVLLLTRAQVNLIVEAVSVSPEMLAALHAGSVSNGTVAVRFSMGGLDELAGAVAAVSNGTLDKKRQGKLDAICEAISQIKQCYRDNVPSSPGAQ